MASRAVCGNKFHRFAIVTHSAWVSACLHLNSPLNSDPWFALLQGPNASLRQHPAFCLGTLELYALNMESCNFCWLDFYMYQPSISNICRAYLFYCLWDWKMTVACHGGRVVLLCILYSDILSLMFSLSSCSLSPTDQITPFTVYLRGYHHGFNQSEIFPSPAVFLEGMFQPQFRCIPKREKWSKIEVSMKRDGKTEHKEERGWLQNVQRRSKKRKWECRKKRLGGTINGLIQKYSTREKYEGRGGANQRLQRKPSRGGTFCRMHSDSSQFRLGWLRTL